MKLVLPLPPNRANARWHWRTEKRKKDAYYLDCFVQTEYSARTVGRWRAGHMGKIRITAHLYLWQTMDEDNLMGRMKWPLDWLVQAGWLEDDNPKCLEWSEIPTQAIDRKNQRIEIELESLSVGHRGECK